MATDPDSILLVYLRRIDEKVDRLSEDMQDLETRVAEVEEGFARVHCRMDRFEARLGPIEKSLDLAEAQR